MRRLRHIAMTVSIGLVVFSVAAVSALSIPPAPTTIPILDNAELLTPEQEQTIAAKIAQERARSSNQIAILTIPSLEGDSLEQFSIKVARDWKVGEKEKDNGVLVVVARDDRTVRIEVGPGLEGILTDAQSSRIIRGEIAPAFQKDDYFGGISDGIDGIIYVLSGEGTYVEPPSSTLQNTKENFWGLAIAGISILSWIGSILSRTKSWWGGGIVGGLIGGVGLILWGIALISILGIILAIGVGLLFDYFVSKNYRQHRRIGTSPSWWAGGSRFGGGGGSSGGFGGFGGGSFGGGGASGRW